MIRLKREQYAVGVAGPDKHGVSVTVGIFYDVPITDDVDELTHTAQRFGWAALALHGGNHVAVVDSVQRYMDHDYPNRPFYVETDEKGRGVQVYQPYGMPQDGTIPTAVHPGPEMTRKCTGPDMKGCPAQRDALPDSLQGAWTIVNYHCAECLEKYKQRYG